MNRGGGGVRNPSGSMMGTGLLGNAPPGFQGTNMMQSDMQRTGMLGMNLGNQSNNMSLLGSVPMQQGATGLGVGMGANVGGQGMMSNVAGGGGNGGMMRGNGNLNMMKEMMGNRDMVSPLGNAANQFAGAGMQARHGQMNQQRMMGGMEGGMPNMAVNQGMMQNSLQGIGGGAMQMNQRMGGAMPMNQQQQQQVGGGGVGGAMQMNASMGGAMQMNQQRNESLMGNPLVLSAVSSQAGYQNTDTNASRSLLPTPGSASNFSQGGFSQQKGDERRMTPVDLGKDRSFPQGGYSQQKGDERRVEAHWDRKDHGGHRDRHYEPQSPVKKEPEEYNPEEPTDDDFMIKKGVEDLYRMNSGSPKSGHKRALPTPHYDEHPQLKRREVILEQQTREHPLHHMMQNGGNNGASSDKFHCHLCNFDGRNIAEFDLHMKSDIHQQRMASISSLYQARTEQQVQRMKAEQMLRRMEKDESDICEICQKKFQTSYAEHKENTEHLRKERMTKRGCILCKTGQFDNYKSYVAHIDSDSHKQAKSKLNVELEEKKKGPNENQTSGSHDQDRQTSSDSHESTTRKSTESRDSSHRRHDSHQNNHKVQQKQSEHKCESNSEKPERPASLRRSRGERHSGNSEPADAQNKLHQEAKMESSGNREGEPGRGYSAANKPNVPDLTKVKTEPMEEEQAVTVVTEAEDEVEMVQEELCYDPDISVGQEFVIPVKGYFCKLCHKFYNSEDMARNTHCKAEKHFEKYQEYVISQQQELNEVAEKKTAQTKLSAKTEVSKKGEKGSSNKFHSHRKASVDQEIQNLSIKISNVQSLNREVDFQDIIDSKETMEVEAGPMVNGKGDATIKRETINPGINRRGRPSRRGRSK